MSMLLGLAGLPLTGPLGSLTWIARRIAEAAEQELGDPQRIEAELLALERQLDAGEIDSATHDAREADLLALLSDLQDRSANGIGRSQSPT